MIVVVVVALLALLAPTPANADMESRVKKLEEELLTIKETSKAILKKLETSVFEGIPEKIQSTGRQIYDAVLHVRLHSTAHNNQPAKPLTVL